jgi:hypothetical protein
MRRTCPHENQVKELAERGQWPQAAAPELRAHASACRACADVALLAAAFRSARVHAAGPCKPVTPGALWWRAQLRQRYQVLERLERPVLGAELFALAVMLVFAAGFLVAELRTGDAWSGGLGAVVGAWSSVCFGLGWEWLALISATVTLLGGVIVYLAAEKD